MENKKTLKSKKPIIQIAVNLILSLMAVYLFEVWIKRVWHLPPLQTAYNIGAIVLTFAMFFVGKTYYTKGVLNNLKKIIIMVLMAVGVLGLMLLSSTRIEDVVYPLSGFFLSGIVFYMISLSTVTINLTGMIWIFMVLLIPVAFLQWFGKITFSTASETAQFIMFIVLFFGATWAEIRAYIHGIRGVNRDGGGAGDNNGDPRDGDGDTDDE